MLSNTYLYISIFQSFFPISVKVELQFPINVLKNEINDIYRLEEKKKMKQIWIR